jgi:high-affinity iron transporter
VLVTFVIGLREGLEAALVVGIVGGFLVRNAQRRELIRMWVGVVAAIAISFGLAIGLSAANRSLPFRARELMEASLAFVAVAGVVYMIVWMRRHAPGLKADLESRAGEALSSGSGWALVAMAFIAVIREGVETAVFLLAATSGSSVPATALGGALLGVGAAVLLGFAIYRGSVRLDLGRFFTATSVVLILVAAGLVAKALHSLGEIGVVGVMQAPAINLSSVISPGTIRASLVTGLLGLQPVPTWAELAGWAVFLMVLLAYVFWPRTTVRQKALVA